MRNLIAKLFHRRPRVVFVARQEPLTARKAAMTAQLERELGRRPALARQGRARWIA